MAIFAISDLHLSLKCNKPMDIFGPIWTGYVEKIRNGWTKTVSKQDCVLIAGDISWATYMDDAIYDLKFVNSLPGRKIISKGNHDYWWSTTRKMQEAFISHKLSSLNFIHNNSYRIGTHLICGARGWKIPEDDNFEQNDMKIYKRELIRLRMSLESAKKIKGPDDDIIVMLHYPPFSSKSGPSGFIDLMFEYNVKKCVFGHIHRQFSPFESTEPIRGIEFFLTSADFLNFIPLTL